MLKAIRRNDILFGIYLILQGIILTVTAGGTFYNIISILGWLISFGFIFEIVVRLFNQRRTATNVFYRILLTVILAGIVILLVAMIAVPNLRATILLASASLTAIMNGVVNLAAAIRIEENKTIRAIIIILSILCVGFGIANWATYDSAPVLLTRAKGIILAVTGAIDIWLGIRAGKAVKK